MFGLFRKSDKTDRKKHDTSCKCIKPCALTEEIMARLNPFLDQYFQETGTLIRITVSADEAMAQAPHTFDLPLYSEKEQDRRNLHDWIQEYQSADMVDKPPAEIDGLSKEFLTGYESDDSAEALFEAIRDTFDRSTGSVQLAFAVSPWSEEFDCEDCVRIFWQ